MPFQSLRIAPGEDGGYASELVVDGRVFGTSYSTLTDEDVSKILDILLQAKTREVEEFKNVIGGTQ